MEPGLTPMGRGTGMGFCGWGWGGLYWVEMGAWGAPYSSMGAAWGAPYWLEATGAGAGGAWGES